MTGVDPDLGTEHIAQTTRVVREAVVHHVRSRQLGLAEYEDPPSRSQDPEFLEVQVSMYGKHPAEAKLLEEAALRLAAERGAAGFTAGDVLEEAGGRSRFPRNLIGAVLGHMRARHILCDVGRRKGDSPLGKGRWVNVFALNAGALRVPPPDGAA